MTIKEMLKKVEVYNEVADQTLVDKTVLKFWVEHGPSTEVKNYKDFAKFVRDEYTEETADRILNCKDYKFDKDVEFIDEWSYGDHVFKNVTKVSFYVKATW